jgi:quercetin dioxygenase-like cupin family protein
MNPLRAPEHGEVVKLGPPAAGEVIITVDPASAGTTFAAGIQTFLPGAEMPVHKHLDRDVVLFVSKGQGRVTLSERILNVVPGAMLHVPRGAWSGVRNTGTGAFQIAWVSAPPGLEAWFRDLSRLGASPSADVLKELALRHRVEFRPAADEPRPAGRGRGQRRGGRRGRGGREPVRLSAPGSPATPSAVPPDPPPTPSSAPAASSAPRGHRRRRHRRGGSTSPLRAGPTVSTSAPAPQPSRPGTGRSRSPQRHHRRRVKEVYMSGRWVRVEGEGPVIASGPQRPGRLGQKPRDDEPPAIPFSVPL